MISGARILKCWDKSPSDPFFGGESLICLEQTHIQDGPLLCSYEWSYNSYTTVIGSCFTPMNRVIALLTTTVGAHSMRFFLETVIFRFYLKILRVFQISQIQCRHLPDLPRKVSRQISSGTSFFQFLGFPKWSWIQPPKHKAPKRWLI